MDGESIFTVQDDRFVPTAFARGPWDPGALHGGAAAALIVEELERRHPTPQLRTGRLSFQFLRPVPAKPLTLITALVRPGRRVQELSAELRSDETVVCLAKALRVQPVSDDLSVHTPAGEHERAQREGMPGPENGDAVRFALDDPSEPSFATAMDMRWLTKPFSLGPGRGRMRPRAPWLPGRAASP